MMMKIPVSRLLTLWVLILGFGWSSASFSQLTSRPQSLELSCIYLYPVTLKYLEKHINYTKLNKNLETRLVDQFVKKLDGSKLYLLAGDVAKIKKEMRGIFRKTQTKNCSGIQKAHAIFKKRVDERVAFAKEYLSKKFKINKKTEIILDPDLRKRPKNSAQANKAHRKYLQYQVASYLITDMKLKEATKQVARNYERVQRRVNEYSNEDIYAFYLDSFARALDPHSTYFSKDALKDFEIQMRLSLEGIGASLKSEDGFTIIEQLISGGAAEKSGKIKPKDKILAVAQGDSKEFKSVVEMDLRDVVGLIRGKKGSKVRLRIIRKKLKETETFEVSLIRDKIKLEDDAASLSVIDREVNGQKKKIGLINLPSFYADNRKNGPSATRDVKKAIKKAKKKGVDSIVLDLSTNGGGSLKDAVDIAGLFFAKGNVVKQSQKSSSGQKMAFEVLDDTDKSVQWSGPLVVLISRVSASASEIVSGTLQDYKRALVVGGDHTFGKGTVQSVEYLPPGLGAVKTTVGMFFTAGGKSTQHRGVDADIVFPSTLSTDEIGEKTLDYSLPPKTIKSFLSKSAVQVGKDAWKVIQPSTIARLRDRSLERISKSEDFKKVKKDIAKNKKRGKKILIADYLNEKDEKEKKGKGEKTDDEDESEGPLTKAQKQAKYLKRADIKEAIEIALDLSAELSGTVLTIGAKGGPTDSNKKKAN